MINRNRPSSIATTDAVKDKQLYQNRVRRSTGDNGIEKKKNEEGPISPSHLVCSPISVRTEWSERSSHRDQHSNLSKSRRMSNFKDHRIQDRNKKVVVTCSLGLCAAIGGKLLKDMGYKDVALLEGGVTKWKEDGYDLEK